MSPSLFRSFLFRDIHFLTAFFRFLPDLCYKSTFLIGSVAADFHFFIHERVICIGCYRGNRCLQVVQLANATIITIPQTDIASTAFVIIPAVTVCGINNGSREDRSSRQQAASSAAGSIIQQAQTVQRLVPVGVIESRRRRRTEYKGVQLDIDDGNYSSCCRCQTTSAWQRGSDTTTITCQTAEHQRRAISYHNLSSVRRINLWERQGYQHTQIHYWAINPESINRCAATDGKPFPPANIRGPTLFFLGSRKEPVVLPLFSRAFGPLCKLLTGLLNGFFSVSNRTVRNITCIIMLQRIFLVSCCVHFIA